MSERVIYPEPYWTMYTPPLHLLPPLLPPPSPQIKKLVYVYLVRYAEEQQDLALLSISTFQKGLKDPNQLIRAGALRVLSSIRVPIIAPIMMLAIKDVSGQRERERVGVGRRGEIDGEERDGDAFLYLFSFWRLD